MQEYSMLPVAVTFTPHESYWIGECTRLGVITQGSSFDEAEINLREALALFVESCQRRGVLEQVLLESGFAPNEITTVCDKATHIFMPDKHIQPAVCHA